MCLTAPKPAGRAHISRGIPRHFPENSPGNVSGQNGYPGEFLGGFPGLESKFPGESTAEFRGKWTPRDMDSP